LNYINNKNNEKNIYTLNILNNIKTKINSIKFYYDTMKTTSIQKITHHETNISKVLTYVATIFLPLSFLIGIFSLPIKNIPFRDSVNSFYYILFIIIIITIISSFYLIQLNKTNVFNEI
jgi:Mg2+ and Co2+ transporter CorA